MKSDWTRFSLILAASFVLAPVAHAQAFRAYLASYGSDANPCAVAAPCRLLPAALTAVAFGGEIWMLDSANFNAGTVNITKSVSILAVPGAVGSLVAVNAGPALSITGGAAVKLRNVVVANNVNNPGTDGVQIQNGSLDVADSQFAVAASATAIVATNATVRVHDSVLRDSVFGIVAHGSSNVDVWKSRFTNIGNTGVFGRADSNAAAATISVSDCAFANVQFGVVANAEDATATMKAAVSRSNFEKGAYAVSIQNIAGTGARGTVSQVTISNHTYGLFNWNNAVLESAGNNTMGSTNFAPSSGTITNVGTH